MIAPNYVMKAVVRRVIDGDTIDVTVSPAFKIKVDIRLRLFGIDTPELNDKDEAKRNKAILAKSHVRNSIEGKDILVQTHKNGDAVDSFGRYLADVYYPRADGSFGFLNQELVELDLAQVFRG